MRYFLIIYDRKWPLLPSNFFVIILMTIYNIILFVDIICYFLSAYIVEI